MNAHTELPSRLTPKGVSRELRRVSDAMVSGDPLARLLKLLADADLSCRNNLRDTDIDDAEMAIVELPDAFQLVLDGLNDALEGARE